MSALDGCEVRASRSVRFIPEETGPAVVPTVGLYAVTREAMPLTELRLSVQSQCAHSIILARSTCKDKPNGITDLYFN
jgi:hypothetical protein